jgi:hypothetical protein
VEGDLREPLHVVGVRELDVLEYQHEDSTQASQALRHERDYTRASDRRAHCEPLYACARPQSGVQAISP